MNLIAGYGSGAQFGLLVYAWGGGHTSGSLQVLPLKYSRNNFYSLVCSLSSLGLNSCQHIAFPLPTILEQKQYVGYYCMQMA